MSSLKTVIYIAGYGRSGSTLLDIILGNTKAFKNTGELSTIYEEYLSRYSCSCGLAYDNCDVWKSYFVKIKKLEKIENIKNITRKIDKRETIFKPWKKDISNHEKKLYAKLHDLMFESLGACVIIDSSKTPADGSFRPVALKELCGYDVKVIHLQRNFFHVMKSLAKGSNKTMQNKDGIRPSFWTQLGLKTKDLERKKRYSKLSNFFRGVLGYHLANRDARKLKDRLGKENYMYLHFEDLINDPIGSLIQIEKQLGLSIKESKEKISRNEYLNIGHIVGGNRMVRKQMIKLERGG
jgi:hypothetical protein